MGTIKVNKAIEEEIYYAPCIKCGCDEIIINNCGYSSFNCGSIKCKECDNEVKINNLAWDADDISIIPYWNEKNDINILIKNLEEHIDKCQIKLSEYKSKLK